MYRNLARVSLFVLLAGVAVVTGGRPAGACSCVARPSADPLEVAGRSNPHYAHAFIGTVAEARTEAFVIDVERVLAGDVPDRVEVDSGVRVQGSLTATDSCAFTFQTGRRYLVEAHAERAGRFSTNICTWTRAWDEPVPPPSPGASPSPEASAAGSGAVAAIAFGALAAVSGLAIAVARRRRP